MSVSVSTIKSTSNKSNRSPARTCKTTTRKKQTTPAKDSTRKKQTTFLRCCKPHLEEIRNDIEFGCSISEICVKYGFNRTNFYKWMKKYPELAEVVEHARIVKIEQLEKTVFMYATDGDPAVRSSAVRAAEFILKAENPDKYVPKDKLQVEGDLTFGDALGAVAARRQRRLAEEDGGA